MEQVDARHKSNAHALSFIKSMYLVNYNHNTN